METLKFKTCQKCKLHKEVSKFHKHKGKKDGLDYICKQCKNIYDSLKIKIDPLFKLNKNILRTIRRSFLYKSANFKKNSRVSNVLGCSLQEFKNHIESQFEPWMNWDNHGLYNGQLNYGWDIDHIIPKATAKTEEEVFKLNHYTNLRPRCSYLNRVTDRIKKDKTKP